MGEWLKALINMESLISSLAGAFFGASAAFLFNIMLNKQREKKEQLLKLQFSVCATSGLLNTLYGIKRDFVLPKAEEAKAFKRAVENGSKTGKDVLFEMKALSANMHHEGLKRPFDIGDLYFITEKGPNIISLIMAFDVSVNNLNTIINDYNAHLFETRGAPDKISCDLLLSYVDNLSAQIDSTLCLAEKVQEILIEYGRLFFKPKFRISSVIRDESIDYLKPSKIDSWENVDWFPIKKAWYKRAWEKINAK